MDPDERERFGGIAARLEAIERRLDRYETNSFTSGQTWRVVLVTVATAIVSTTAGVAITLATR